MLIRRSRLLCLAACLVALLAATGVHAQEEAPSPDVAPAAGPAQPSVDQLILQATQYSAAGRWQDAIPVLETVLGANEQNANAQYLIARALHAQGSVSDALPHYERAAALDSGSVAVRTALAEAYLDLRRPSDAVTTLQGVTSQHPERSGLWSSLAYAQAEAGDPDGAIDSVRKAITLDPTNLDAQVLFALFLELGKQPDAAVAQSGSFSRSTRQIRLPCVCSSVLLH